MSATEQGTASAVSSRTFPFYRFAGTHRQIGAQFGEACREPVRRHLDKALSRLGGQKAIGRDEALDKAMRYRPYVRQYAPFFDDEIQGLAAGAGLSLPEAYLLQLRAEVATPITGTPEGDDTQECTTFAVQPEATANGKPLAGQNADLPSFYGEVAVVVELIPDDQPSVLMLTPAGQVSYIGINDRGLGVFANFITCDGWRYGLPRYLWSRLALTQESVDDAIDLVRSVRRASSRNLIMADARGAAADLETTPTRDARLEPENGLLAHSNHYVAETLQDEERSQPRQVANSRERLRRMQELLVEHHGRIDPSVMQDILRDRICYPDAICRMPTDDADGDMMTFASVIGSPADGRLWVAVGPPNEHAYVEYAFGA